MPSNDPNAKNEYTRATPGVIIGSLITYVGAIFLLMSFCSPYWIESYKETHSSFLNMGLWEYCFKQFQYPYYQFPRTFTGCHNIFSDEYYVIREWLLPPWLMVVQTFVCIGFIMTFYSLVILSLVVIRLPLKTVLQYEWVLVSMAFIGDTVSTVGLFLAAIVFGANCYRRDWQMYPKFNVISWGYSLCVVSAICLALASLIFYREAKKAYETRGDSQNLVAQMEMHEPGYQPPKHHHSHSRSLQGGYI